MLLQLAQRDRPALLREPQLELVGDRLQDLVARERGRGEIDRADLGRQPLHQHAAEHGLAAADFARDLDDALVVQHGVDQRFQGRAAVGAVEEEIGVRRDPERRLGQPEMLEVERHAYFSSVVFMRLYRVVRLMPSSFAAWLTLPRVRRSAASM